MRLRVNFKHNGTNKSVSVSRCVSMAEKSLTEQHALQILQAIYGPKTYETIEISNGMSKGDGFLSFMTCIDADKDVHVLVKHAISRPGFEKYIELRVLFDREMFYYETLMPTLQKFAGDRAGDCFSWLPKCHGILRDNGKQMLVFENLRLQGFQMWNSVVQLRDRHAALIMREYGKMHAVSFAMQDQERRSFEAVTRGMKNLFNKAHIYAIYCQFEAAAKNAVKVFESGSRMHAAMKEFSEKFNEVMAIKDQTQLHRVVLHGDCWSNNMMFKFEGDNPISLRFVDFQLTGVGSPVLDLSNFLYTSCCKEVLDDLDKYMRIYHDSLCKYMKQLESDAHKLYPYEQLKSDWKQYSRFGFAIALLTCKGNLVAEDELVDICDLLATGQPCESAYSKPVRLEFLVNERIGNICMHMVDNGFI